MRVAILGLVYFLVSSFAAVPGCSKAVVDPSPSHGGPDARQDAGPSFTIRFDDFGDDGTVVLAYRESWTFGVIVLEDGEPAAGVRVHLGLEGNAQDSSLLETTVTSNSEGRATGTLVAATVSTSFWLRASLSMGETARLAIRTVAPAGVRVSLDPLYDGMRNVPTYEVRLLVDSSCPPIYPGPADPRAERVIVVDAASPTFTVDRDLLLAQLRILLVGLDAGSPLTWGCVDGVSVPATDLHRLRIAMSDLPWPRPGRHKVEMRLPVATVAEEVVAEAFLPFAPLLNREVTDGEFVIDGLVSQMQASDNWAAAAVLEAGRSGGGLVDAISRAVAGLGEALARIRDTTTEFLQAAVFTGEVELGEADDNGNGEAIERWRAIRSGTTTLDLGADAQVPVEGTARTIFASDRISLGRRDLPLSLGFLVGLVLTHAAGSTGAHWGVALSEWLHTALSCPSVVDALAASASDLVDVCDPSCLLAACEAWRAGLVTSSIDALAAAEANHNTLSAGSSCVFLDTDGRLFSTGRCDGTIEAHWRGLLDVLLVGTWSVVPTPSP